MIREQLTDGVLTVVLDRPDKRNAMTIEMRDYLENLGARCNGDDDVRCVVITGAGQVFSAGADLRELQEHDGEVPNTNPTVGVAAVNCPVIAAVDGMCVTGGLEVALAADIIVASPAARFSDTHAKLGVVPRWGMTKLLTDRIGEARTTEMMLTGRWVEADEGARIGLVDVLLGAVSFDDDVAGIAQAIADRDPALVTALRGLIADNASRSFANALVAEADVGAAFGLDGGI